jgi:hypothetical protein
MTPDLALFNVSGCLIRQDRLDSGRYIEPSNLNGFKKARGLEHGQDS